MNDPVKVGVIIQARMASTRLPGKVLMTISDIPLLKIMVDRVRHANQITNIIVATSTSTLDDKIVEFCQSNDIESFRGSENDVLSRYYECSMLYDFDIIVRLTGDCPLIDPKIIDQVILLFKKSGADYASNTIPLDSSTYPDGSDVEVFSKLALISAQSEVSDSNYREHVTFHFWKDENSKFKTVQLTNQENWSKYRITVDYPEDFEVVKYLFGQIEGESPYGQLKTIIRILKKNPEVKKLNKEFYSGMGWGKDRIVG
jgi:spore coat polysaccharide biosynthesis protein SpsF